MNSEFKICKSGNCGVTITGLELDNGSYLDESSVLTSFRTYKYSESITMNALSSINLEEVETLVKYENKDHSLFPIDDSTFIMPKDGLYALFHLIIPTKTWLDNVLAKNPDDLKMYDTIIYFDVTDETYYKYIDSITKEVVTVSELLNLTDITKSTVVLGVKNTFNLCYLNECFYKINKMILDTLPKKCKTDISVEDFSFKRDILWMAINTIKYAIETQQLFEALRILENVNNCHSICDSLRTYKYNSCGCN